MARGVARSPPDYDLERMASGSETQHLEVGMRIKEITSQFRRDFEAVYECEHCGYEARGRGYDDSNFHLNVIPAMHCESCGETAAANYRPLATKYPDSQTV